MATPMIFKLRDETYRVVQKKFYQDKLKQGYAYLLSQYNDYVYPYRGEVDSLDEAVQVGIYLIRGRAFPVRPRNDEERMIFHKDRIIQLTPDCIFRNLNDMVIDPVIETEVITDGDVFKPALRQTDDIALAAMKYAIGQKNINFNQYGHKFSDMATKNNGRRALTHGNTLKMDMLSRFADVFDLNAGIIIWDKYGCPNPMSSDYSTVYCVFDDQALDFDNAEKYTFKTIEREV